MAAELPLTSTLDVVREEGWLTIWLAQPRRRNALSAQLRDEMVAVFAAVAQDRSVRGITLRGRGGIFCAGGDLRSFKGEPSREEVRQMSRAAAELFDRVNRAPQVVVAVVEGAAMAGGLGLACCADVVICEATTRFALTEVTLGLSPAQIARFVIQKVGYSTARRLMLTGAYVDGEEARALGLADLVGDVEALEGQVRADVRRCAPGAVAQTKALLLALPRLPAAESVEEAAHVFADRIASEEAKQGVQAFLEKRSPPWGG